MISPVTHGTGETPSVLRRSLARRNPGAHATVFLSGVRKPLPVAPPPSTVGLVTDCSRESPGEFDMAWRGSTAVALLPLRMVEACRGELQKEALQKEALLPLVCYSS